MIQYYFSPNKCEIDSAQLMSDIRKAIKGNILPLGERSYIKLVLVEIIEKMERPKKMAEQGFALYFPDSDGSYRLNAALGLIKCELEDIPHKENSNTAWIVIHDIIKELESNAYPDDESELCSEPQIYVARDIWVDPQEPLGNGFQSKGGHDHRGACSIH